MKDEIKRAGEEAALLLAKAGIPMADSEGARELFFTPSRPWSKTEPMDLTIRRW